MTETLTAEQFRELNFRIPNRTPITIPVKPMSVNQCWQGKRFKTPEYKAYEKHLLLILPKLVIPPGKLKIVLEFGVSNVQSDIDNPVKPLLDVLQKKYWFNDSQIWELTSIKVKVPKGKEYSKFEFIALAI